MGWKSTGGPVRSEWWWQLCGVLCVLSVLSSSDARGAEGAVTSAKGSITIGFDSDEIRGKVVFEVRLEAGVTEMPFWFFPNRLSKPSKHLDDTNVHHHFPRGFSEAWMRADEPEVAGCPSARWGRSPAPGVTLLIFDSPLANPKVCQVAIDYTLRVPRRFGPFGVIEDVMTMDGGFFPRPVPGRVEGSNVGQVPLPLKWTWEVRNGGARPLTVLLAGQRHDLLQGRSGVSSGISSRISLIAFKRVRESVFRSDGRTVNMLHTKTRHIAQSNWKDWGHIDVHGQALGTAMHQLKWLESRLGSRFSSTPPLVEVPLRRELAIGAMGEVLVSDRLFEVVSLKSAQRVHRLALARALFTTLLRPRLQCVAIHQREQLLDMVAFALAAEWDSLVYRETSTLRAVMRAANVFGSVDDAVKAPQAPLSEAFLGVADDHDVLRDRLALFDHTRPSGRFWWYRVQDRYGESRARELVSRLTASTCNYAQALGALGDAEEVSNYLEQWAGGVPKLNYALRTTGTQAKSETFEIARDGGDAQFKEVVELEVRYLNGEQITHRVLMDSPRYLWTSPLEQPVAFAQLDPRHRLVESGSALLADPRADNSTETRWRFLLDGLYAQYNSAAERVDLSLFSTIKPEHDPRHRVLFGAHDGERSLGASMTYLFGFGAALRPNLYRHALGFGVSGSWLKPLDNATNGYALRVTLSVGDSTYKSRTHPKEGGRVSLRAGPILSEQGQGLKIGGTLSGFASGVQRLGPGHVIGGRLHLAALIGDFAKPEPFGIGGLGGVRAFAPFVGAGRYLGIAGVEWRHEYTRNINLNVFHAVWLTGIDGVMFVDAALVADTLNGLGASRALYTGAGYGLRFHYLVGGIYPMVLLCDVGVPVLTEGAMGPRGVAPLSVNLALEQAF